MIDTHCHLTSSRFHGRVEDVIADANAAGVDGMITVATHAMDAQAALEIARAHSSIWCSSGVHPLYAAEDDPSTRDWQVIKQVAADPNCVAWGELGLDNYYDTPGKHAQQQVLDQQLALIADSGIDKPIIVHCREAFDELIAAFGQSGLDASRFVFHCFTAGPPEAKAVLDFGAMISFTGVVTFKNSPEVADAAKLLPADRIMVETDAPYLTPEPHRKVRPNEPKFVKHTAAHIAALRNMPAAEFEALSDANAKRFFRLD